MRKWPAPDPFPWPDLLLSFPSQPVRCNNGSMIGDLHRRNGDRFDLEAAAREQIVIAIHIRHVVGSLGPADAAAGRAPRVGVTSFHCGNRPRSRSVVEIAAHDLRLLKPRGPFREFRDPMQ